MIQSISSPFQVPVTPGALCVILDASFAPHLQTSVDQAISYGAERCVSLFENTPYTALQSAGPFALLCAVPGALTEYACGLLERADAGCVAYLKDDQSFDRAVEHWRSLLTVSTDETPAQMMRFFEPRWLEPLLCSLDEAELLQFMGPLTDMVWRNELGWRHLAHPHPGSEVKTQATGCLHLSHERQDGMQLQRLKVLAGRFTQDYHGVLSMDDPLEFVYRQLIAAQQAGYLQVAEQERWLRVSLSKGDDFWHRSPSAELLARDDLSLGDKLIELEGL
ncbi:DUF4123 domain-containing protein [Pseudomonas sp. BP8]|uniref:DUF4123 domain-containing protein n=1 Tax=Pseudomonas sp. BP8 TaxID=2817864 RepID=UPI001AE35D40|nr:DUF4123 domain-containing protein [Pseudomonas sp. BP8]MBP2263268.1 hypothetical protein [Pseudomonas sp. BP8]HDS1735285.1 DUF4123 domain-containing protein [Pseudomonas putida]